MGGMLRRKHGPGAFLGIDINAAHIRLLELDGTGNTVRATAYASEPLPPGAVFNDQILDVVAVGETIKRARSKSGTRNINAAVSVPGSAVINKTITLPAGLSADEIEQQILLQAPRHIPYPIDDVSLDFQMLGTDPVDDSRDLLLLVACRRDNVEMRTAALELAGLKPRWVDVEEYAVRNACALLHDQPSCGGGQTIAMLEVGTHKSQLNIQSAGHPTHSHEVSVGDHALADALDRADPAGAFTHQREKEPAACSDETTLDTFCEQLAQEIVQALQAHTAARTTPKPIDRILLTGRCTRYPGIEMKLRERMRCPVVCADPLRKIHIDARARHNNVEQDSATLMLAAGLSMRAWQ